MKIPKNWFLKKKEKLELNWVYITYKLTGFHISDFFFFFWFLGFMISDEWYKAKLITYHRNLIKSTVQQYDRIYNRSFNKESCMNAAVLLRWVVSWHGALDPFHLRSSALPAFNLFYATTCYVWNHVYLYRKISWDFWNTYSKGKNMHRQAAYIHLKRYLDR